MLYYGFKKIIINNFVKMYCSTRKKLKRKTVKTDYVIFGIWIFLFYLTVKFHENQMSDKILMAQK